MRRLLFALALCWAWPAAGQVYPAKPVRIIVAQGPGGASDLLIRLITQKLTESLGQQFIIDNRPGAGGNIGAEVAAKAAPDGYTLFMVSAPHAVASSRRVRALPDVPTIAESGYAGYEAVNWFGIVAPARTPDEIVRKLNAAIKQSVAAPDVREFYENRGADQTTNTPEEMRAFLQSETAKWAAVVKASGARID